MMKSLARTTFAPASTSMPVPELRLDSEAEIMKGIECMPEPEPESAPELGTEEVSGVMEGIELAQVQETDQEAAPKEEISVKELEDLLDSMLNDIP